MSLTFGPGTPVFKCLCEVLGNTPKTSSTTIQNKLKAFLVANPEHEIGNSISEKYDNKYKELASRYNQLKKSSEADIEEEEKKEIMKEFDEEEEIPHKKKPVPRKPKQEKDKTTKPEAKAAPKKKSNILDESIIKNAPTEPTMVEISDDGSFKDFLIFCDNYLAKKATRPSFNKYYNKFVESYTMFKSCVDTIINYCSNNDITAIFNCKTHTFTYKLITNDNKIIKPVPFTSEFKTMYKHIATYYELCDEMNKKYKIVNLEDEQLIEYFHLSVWDSQNVYCLEQYDIPYFCMNFMYSKGEEKQCDVYDAGVKYETMLLYSDIKSVSNVFKHRYGILINNECLTDEIKHSKYEECKQSIKNAGIKDTNLVEMLHFILESKSFYSVLMNCCKPNAKYLNSIIYKIFKLDIKTALYPISFIYSSNMLGGECMRVDKKKKMNSIYQIEINDDTSRLHDNLRSAWIGLINVPMDDNPWMSE